MKIGSFDINRLSTFDLARLRLTGFYLLTIMILSVLFSLAIFRLQSDDLYRRLAGFEIRIGRGGFIPNRLPPTSTEVIEASIDQLKWNLANINIAIFLVSAGASYLLAGLTLRPIKRSLDEQSRFVADASHEMRTPLTALKTSTEVALRDRKLTPAGAKKLLRANLTKINTIEGLSEALLSLANDGVVTSNLEESVDLKEIAEEAVEGVSTQAKAKHIKLTQNLAPVNILGSKSDLTELVTILLDNAIKYTPSKGQVSISLRGTRGEAILEVADTGVGIDTFELPHIFERFYRADKSRSADTAGFGLGLSIAQKISASHGGEITVNSRSGKGSTFTLRLPQAYV